MPTLYLMTLLTGKRAIIFGLISRHSLAYGIAAAMKQAGAEIAFSYQNEAIAYRIKPLAATLGASFCQPCDVSQDVQISKLFTALQTHWDTFDILVHALAYAPKEQLRDDYLENTTREGFRMAHDISSYSFTALAKQAKPMLRRGGALLTLTYLGSERAVPHYNVMGVAKASLEANVRYMAKSLGPSGIRVNAISAGPVRTLAASGIKDFKKILTLHEAQAPLQAMTTLEQVGQAAVCLCSDWMSGVTGDIVHVDGGFHAVSPGE
jgi:enoyl-[acyl-carrier protein] reductase I